MSKILLVEDDASLGATLCDRLIKEGYATQWAKSKKEAATLATNSDFDLYIMDVGLPDGTGFQLAQELPKRPLIFLTAQGDAESRLQGYELGAEEYIPKPFHLRELLLRVRHVLENHAPRLILELTGLRIDFESFEFIRDGKKEVVASRDLILLRLLVENSPKVVTRDEAVATLRGEDKFPSNRTVDNAILRLRTSLGVHADRIESVRGVGYRWVPEKERQGQ
ncbi:MAG: response regulator transcription factor [Bdellovibrionales bacterium]